MGYITGLAAGPKDFWLALILFCHFGTENREEHFKQAQKLVQVDALDLSL